MTMLGDSVRRRQGHRAARQREPKPRGGRSAWKKWLPAAIAAAVIPFGVGYLLAVYVFFPPADAGVAGIPVPSVVGLQAVEAEAALTAAGLGALEVSELPHPQQRQGTIIAQSPLPGQQLRAGSVVRVAVSAGPPRAVVPDVVGFEIDRVQRLLIRLGFLIEMRIEESDVPEGRVIRVDPQPGTERELPATVMLTVSSGPPPLEFEPDPLAPDTLRSDTLPPDTLGATGLP
jgi:eukaryotic-like serine/threonine-protein kinase